MKKKILDIVIIINLFIIFISSLVVSRGAPRFFAGKRPKEKEK